MNKILKSLLWLLLIGIIIAGAIYAWPRLPIITAFAAKGMCSCVFVADRDPASVEKQDLSFFPISLATAKVNYDDKSVTASLLGLVKRKAVYRDGLGCAVIVDFPEQEIRKQTLPELATSPITSDTSWPLGDRLPDTLISGVDYNKLKAAVDSAFDEPGAEPLLKTQAVVVIYNNNLVTEKYAEGFDVNTKCLSWSMAKSITNALVGIMVRDRKLDIYQSTGIDEWERDERSNITINNLMHMNAGLQWVENYFNLSEVTKMLYMRGDMYRYAVTAPPEYKTDSVWYYASGMANIITGIIRETIGNDDQYHSFPYTELFYKIGMTHTVFETDASGNFVGSSYCWTTPRDWARFGMLYLNNGVFEGDTILPDWWVNYTTTPANGSDGLYGAMFFLWNQAEFPDVPEDMYFCDGFLGQRIFIIPSKKLVVVRNGYSMKDFDMNQFLKNIIEALPDLEPGTRNSESGTSTPEPGV
jgi:CubicO group peptidase (beta-lactamase class C family)